MGSEYLIIRVYILKVAHHPHPRSLELRAPYPLLFAGTLIWHSQIIPWLCCGEEDGRSQRATCHGHLSLFEGRGW